MVPSLALEPGSLFAGDYRIVRPLAAGGMGAVYVVDQMSTGKPRALKVMRPELVEDADARRRFELEARIGSKIPSEHIVEVSSAGIDDETKMPFLIMELLIGEDLASRIKRSGPIPAADVASLFQQIGHAIGAAHAVGVVHRDLKPENIFLSTSKRANHEGTFVKVLDFGVAKLAAETATKGATTNAVGTPLWMSPEQTEQGRVTSAADVWALGLIAYYVLTGSHFWLSARDPNATIAQVIREIILAPIPAATVRAIAQGKGHLVPPAFDAVFARSVTREVGQRYIDGAEMVRALAVALAGAPPPRMSEPRVLLAARPQGANVPRILPIAPGMGPSSSGGIPVTAIRYILFGIVAMMMIFFSVFLMKGMRARQEAMVEQQYEQPIDIPTGPVSPPAAAVSSKQKVTASIEIDGPLTRTDASAVIEPHFGSFESCVYTRRGNGHRGTIVVHFFLAHGKAITRKIVASDLDDGSGECILETFSDMTFPSSGDTSGVNCTLVFR